MPTDEEKKREHAKKMQEEAQRLAKERRAVDIDELRKRAREDRKASIGNEMSRLKEKGFMDLGDQRLPLWDALKKKARDAASPRQASYESWATAMLQLLEVLTILHNAISHSRQVNVTTPLWGHTKNVVSNLAIRSANKFSDLAVRLKESIFPSDMSADIPALVQDVTMDSATNKLDVGKLKFVDGTVVQNAVHAKHPKQASELDMGMQVLVPIWLNEKGYEPKKDAAGHVVQGEYVSKANAAIPLTKAVFEGLRDDPQTGLAQFLTQTSNLDFRAEAPSAPPGP